MAFKERLRQGILSYIYHKIAEDGKFVIRLPEDFLKHVLNPFLSYYMSQIDITFDDSLLKIKGSSLVPVDITLKNPVVRENEMVIPMEMNNALHSFITTFGAERLKPIKVNSDSVIIPLEIIYNAVKDIAEDLKISKISITKEGVYIEIVSR